MANLPRHKTLLNNNKDKCTKHVAHHGLLVSQICRAPSAMCPAQNHPNRVLAGLAPKIALSKWHSVVMLHRQARVKQFQIKISILANLTSKIKIFRNLVEVAFLMLLPLHVFFVLL